MRLRPTDRNSPQLPAFVGALSIGLLVFAEPCPGQGERTDRPPLGIGRVAKTLDGEREIRGRIDSFFGEIIAGNSAAAFAGLMKGSPLSSKQEAIDKLVQDTAQIVETYGAIRSYEPLRISRLGSRMIRFTYLSYSDDYPLKWEIYCFLGKSGWQILDFGVNNDFTELFDDPGVRRPGAAPRKGD